VRQAVVAPRIPFEAELLIEYSYNGYIDTAIIVCGKALTEMVKSVNIAELKNRLSVYLNEVRSGHEVLVRDRNTPIARIVPIVHNADQDDELRALAAQGKIRLAEGAMDDAFWDLPAPRVSADALRRVLENERNER